MVRKQGNGIRGLVVTALCLLAGSPLISISASAQASHAGQKPKTPNSGAQQKEVTFEVVSIRPLKPGTQTGTTLNPTPNGYVGPLTVEQMIKLAYVPGYFENWDYTPLVNAPKWLHDDNAKYQVNARVSSKDLNAWQHQDSSIELLRSAFRELLKERFKLAIHMQPKDTPDYKLVVAKKGHKMILNAPDPHLKPYDTFLGGGYMAVTKMNGRAILEEYLHGVTMGDFCKSLSMGSGLPPVHDATGLTGRYDFTLKVNPNKSDSNVTPWQIEQLGLTLKPGKYHGFSIIVDHVESPTAN